MTPHPDPHDGLIKQERPVAVVVLFFQWRTLTV